MLDRCDRCGFWIPLGGVRQDGFHYCCDECAQYGPLIPRSRQVPAVEVRLAALKILSGRCEMCSGPGPVEVRRSYRIWSFVVLSHFSTRLQISCRLCGLKAQLRGIASSMLLGWWSLPVGVVMTPVQIGRNLWAMLVSPDGLEPTPALLQQASLIVAETALMAEQRSS
jgi:hypothetical protein